LGTDLSLSPTPSFGIDAVPLTADVIDHDSGHTSQRREATYLGATSFVERTAVSAAPLIRVLLRPLGDTRAHSLGIRLAGPVAGVIVFAGFLMFRRYDAPDEVGPPVGARGVRRVTSFGAAA
jgi:hypothetical protein